ncbi:MAG: metallophosphoesterase [Clostridia bacterium]|nr:metallophosphoesterase [Clostridia bacterium]
MFRIQKPKDRDFIILNLTDIHADNCDWSPDHKYHAPLVTTIRQTIERVKPDLITLSGDYAWAGQYESYIHLGKLREEYNTPWTLIWGNHDQDKGYGILDRVIESLKQFEHLIYENGPEELGRGNFVVAICEGEKIVEGLIMMDTHDRVKFINKDGKEDWGWGKVFPNQIEWYKENVCKLTDLGCKETMVITHQPIYAYKFAIKNALKDGIDVKSISVADALKGEHFKDGYDTSFGINYEDVCCFKEDEGFFDVIKELDSTKNCLCGHDHVNFSSIVYEGVRFTFGLKAGRGAYWRPDLSGGTVITVSSEGITNIRHEFVDVAHLVKD